MRRVLALLIVIVLPLKALAAVALPIVGTPDHQHAADGHEHVVVDAGAPAGNDGHSCCDGLSDQSPASAGTLHDHSCPHLAMATLVPAQPSTESEARITAAAPCVAAPFDSVVLDLPVPPPTRQS